MKVKKTVKIYLSREERDLLENAIAWYTSNVKLIEAAEIDIDQDMYDIFNQVIDLSIATAEDKTTQVLFPDEDVRF